MTGQTLVLRSDASRATARRLVDLAPPGSVFNIRAANRTTQQNSLLWSLLSDVSRAKPEGRCHTPEVWKTLFMAACGHAVQFENGLNGQPFPVGFRSSRLSKSEMSDLIEFVIQWGTEHGVRFDERDQAA